MAVYEDFIYYSNSLCGNLCLNTSTIYFTEFSGSRAIYFDSNHYLSYVYS